MKNNIDQIEFESTAFPTADDMKMWHRLTPAEQQAVVDRDVNEGLQGPPAKRQTKDEVVAAVLARYAADAV